MSGAPGKDCKSTKTPFLHGFKALAHMWRANRTVCFIHHLMVLMSHNCCNAEIAKCFFFLFFAAEPNLKHLKGPKLGVVDHWVKVKEIQELSSYRFAAIMWSVNHFHLNVLTEFPKHCCMHNSIVIAQLCHEAKEFLGSFLIFYRQHNKRNSIWVCLDKWGKIYEKKRIKCPKSFLSFQWFCVFIASLHIFAMMQPCVLFRCATTADARCLSSCLTHF